jgi:hypothetical protein
VITCRILKPHACISAQCMMHTGIFILNTRHGPAACPAAAAAISYPLRTAGRLCGMSPLSLAASPQSSSIPPCASQSVLSGRSPSRAPPPLAPPPHGRFPSPASARALRITTPTDRRAHPQCRKRHRQPAQVCSCCFLRLPAQHDQTLPPPHPLLGPPAHSHHMQLISRLHAVSYNSQHRAAPPGTNLCCVLQPRLDSRSVLSLCIEITLRGTLVHARGAASDLHIARD